MERTHSTCRRSSALAIVVFMVVVLWTGIVAAESPATLVVTFRDEVSDDFVPNPHIWVIPKAIYDARPDYDWYKWWDDHTAPNGEVRHPPLEPGRYVVLCRADGFSGDRFEVELAPGQTRTKRMYLTRDGASHGSPNPPQPPSGGGGPPSTGSRNTADDCWARKAEHYREMRQALAAQDPSDGSVWLPYDETPQCLPALRSCEDAARSRFDLCPPGTDGTYRHCQVQWAKEKIECCRQSLDCGERFHKEQCGVSDDRQQSTADSRCTEDVRSDIASKRAHNAAQTVEGGVSPMIMNMVSACSDGFNACWNRAREVYAACPPGSDGTYTHCTHTQSQTFLECADQEIACTERSLGCR